MQKEEHIKEVLAMFDHEDIKYIKSAIYLDFCRKKDEKTIQEQCKKKKLGGIDDRFRK